MTSEEILADGSDAPDDPGTFLEMGTNRLARDLFLLTAVYALFVVMFLAASFQLAADRSWADEALLDESAEHDGGLLLAIHLRKDGRIRVGEETVSEPESVAGVVRNLIEENPEFRNARVILNTYRGTPSVRTSDATISLAEAGLDSRRFHLRFTEE